MRCDACNVTACISWTKQWLVAEALAHYTIVLEGVTLQKGNTRGGWGCCDSLTHIRI